MSYFEHTKRDVTEASLAGRRKVAEEFAALLDDTARKMNADEPFDRQYLVEDLLTRGMELAKNYAADMPKLFPALVDSVRNVPAYPMLIENVRPHAFEAAHSPGACTAMVMRNGYGEDCGLAPEHSVHRAQEDTIDLTDAIRETWEAQTFNGIPRHEHVGMPEDKCYHSFSGVRCNHYYGHAVHETDFESRSNRA